MEAGERDGALLIRPLTLVRVDDVKKVMSGTWGGTGWDLWPRYTQKQQRQRGLALAPDAKRRAELARLARAARRARARRVPCGEPIG